ncbi:MAG: undecaprenyldiphospho-muramoylpentapeptide beta-N-acetylglucosaminyltransferase [Bacillota bacterium]
MKAIISGGGTGGHIYPALSLAMKMKNNDWMIKYIGSVDGLEKSIIKNSGIVYEGITVSPLPRKIKLKTFKALLKNSRGFIQSLKIIKSYNPQVVIGTGGFVAGPVLLAASLYGIPTLIHEQNVYPGLTNRLLSRIVDKIAINFENAIEYFPDKISDKIILTGIPVRDSIKNNNSNNAYDKFSLNPDKLTIFVFGGSQGAAAINNVMVNLYNNMCNDFMQKNWQFIHITGPANYDKIRSSIKKIDQSLLDNDLIKLFPYLDNIELAYAAADIAIARAGATGLAEIAVSGLPAILIPYPYASGNHQLYNAQQFAKMGAGCIIKEKDLNHNILMDKLTQILNNKEKLKKMGENSSKLANDNALSNLYKVVLNLI